MDINMIINYLSQGIQAALMIIGGSSIFLKWIAPRTKTLIDDKIYAKLEKALKFLSVAEEKVNTLSISVNKK